MLQCPRLRYLDGKKRPDGRYGQKDENESPTPSLEKQQGYGMVVRSKKGGNAASSLSGRLNSKRPCKWKKL